MINLLERAPESWHVVEADGYPPSIQFCYGVQWDQTHLLPLGARYGVVYSPNTLVHPQSPLRPWHYVTFEVCLYQFRRGRPLERSFKQVKDSRRQLTRFEVPHFEALWLNIGLMGRQAG